MNKYELFLKQRKREKRIVLSFQFFILFFLLILWEICSSMSWIDPLIFSKPSMITQLMVEKTRDGSLSLHIGITLLETVISFIVGTGAGIIASIFLWWSPTSAKVSDPYLVVLNAMPKVALGPILIVIFGPSFFSIIIMGALLSIIITTIVIYRAFQEVDTNYIKVMQTFGATKWQIFRYVIFPASKMTIVSSLKVNVGLSWVGVIVGEFLVAKMGLGYMIIYGFQVFHFTLVWLSIVCIVLLASVMYKVVHYLETRV